MTTDVLSRGRATGGRSAAPIDPRLQARRIEVARDRGRRRLRRLCALAALAAVGAGAFAVTRSPLLDVDDVRIEATGRTSAGEIRRAAGVALGDPLVSVDPGEVAARVERLPWVADARVTRSWPGTLEVEVSERVAVAVAGPEGGRAVVDRHGRVLGAATDRDSALPVVSAGRAGSPAPAPGHVLDADGRAVVAVLSDLPAGLRSDVASASTGPRGMVLVLADGIEVELGDRSRLTTKVSALEALLEQAGRSTIATIDLRVPGTQALTRRGGPGDDAATGPTLTDGERGGA